VVAPGELVVDEDPEVSHPWQLGDLLDALDGVGVLDPQCVAADEVGVAGPSGKGDEFGLVGVCGQAVAVELGEGLFQAKDRGFGSGICSGGCGIDGAVIDIHCEVTVGPGGCEVKQR